MALSQRFISQVLKAPEFGRRLLSVVVDEAHVASHWGAQFRKAYGRIGIIRAFLPKGTPFVAISATLPAKLRSDVLSKLQFGKDFVNIDIGNDRTNVSLISRAIQQPMITYIDLDFVIRKGIMMAEEIDKTFLYADSITTGVEIINHLTTLLPPHLQSAGIIRPYNALMSKACRKELMVDLVVQWKLPASISAFIQRAGRAARGHGREGLAVLLVEPSAYGIDQSEQARKKAKEGKQKKNKKADSNLEKKARAAITKAYAKHHGVERGGEDKEHDIIWSVSTAKLDPEATDEGIHVFVQAGTCRRAVLSEIYRNNPAGQSLKIRN